MGYSHIHSDFKCLHLSGRVYISWHVHFNPEEFPFSSLWASSSSGPQSPSGSQSTLVLHGISLFPVSPSHQSQPQVAQPFISSSHARLRTYNDSIDHTSPRASKSLESTKDCLSSKLQPAVAPSIHLMIACSKSKQLAVLSPHALVSSLEPNSVQEAFLDPKWVSAMNDEFFALQCNRT